MATLSLLVDTLNCHHGRKNAASASHGDHSAPPTTFWMVSIRTTEKAYGFKRQVRISYSKSFNFRGTKLLFVVVFLIPNALKELGILGCD